MYILGLHTSTVTAVLENAVSDLILARIFICLVMVLCLSLSHPSASGRLEAWVDGDEKVLPRAPLPFPTCYTHASILFLCSKQLHVSVAGLLFPALEKTGGSFPQICCGCGEQRCSAAEAAW